MRHSSTIPRCCAGAVRRRDSRPGRIGWKRRGCSSVAKRLRADDDALLAPGPNFKTLTSTPSISFDSHRLRFIMVWNRFLTAVLELTAFSFIPGKRWGRVSTDNETQDN